MVANEWRQTEQLLTNGATVLKNGAAVLKNGATVLMNGAPLYSNCLSPVVLRIEQRELRSIYGSWPASEVRSHNYSPTLELVQKSSGD